ncbi:MAG: hypothetical protein H6766_04210 [Candidatus Peribacteria bacterium]|nr:MAG: hypothetical protein H6766_04210 [Candidatus Peribacteria bacterium]
MTASQYIDPGCVVKVRNYKLKIIVDNNYCPRPAAWDPTTNPDGSINLPTEEEPVIQHEQMSNNINLTSYIYNPQVDYTNSIVEYYGGIQAQTEVTQNSGDPVDLARGAMVWSNTLMDEPTEGEDFQLVVTYDNQASYNGIM